MISGKGSDYQALNEKQIQELESLKKRLDYCEKERDSLRQLYEESKHPIDVQSILRQKRELQTQLEREESEKHELFSQINQLIGEIAQLRQDSEIKTSEKSDIEALKIQLQETQNVVDKVKRDCDRKEREHFLVSSELVQFKDEMKLREQTFQLEKNSLNQKLQDVQEALEQARKSLLNKSANDDEKNILVQRVKMLEAEIFEKDDLLSELTESNDELSKALTEANKQYERSQKQHDQLSKKLDDEKTHLKRELDSLKHQLTSKENEFESIKRKLVEESERRQRSEKALSEKENELILVKSNLNERHSNSKDESFEQKELFMRRIRQLECQIQENESKNDEFDTLRTKVCEYELKLSEKEFLLEKALTTVNLYEDSLKEIREERDQLEVAELDRSKQIENLEAHLNNLTENQKYERAKENQKFSEKENNLNNTIDELKRQMNQEIIKYSKRESNLLSQIENLNKELEVLTAEIEEARNRSGRFDQSSQELVSFQKKVEDLTNENTRLSAGLLEQQINAEKELRQMLARERDECSQRLQTKNQELTELKKRIDDLLSQQQDQEEEFHAIKSQLQQQINGRTAANTLPNVTASDANEAGRDLESMTAELAKQKRIVMVLRKKLQRELIEQRLREKQAKEEQGEGATKIAEAANDFSNLHMHQF